MTRSGTARWQVLGYKSRAEWLLAGGDDATPCPPGVEWYYDHEARVARSRMRRKPGRPPAIKTPEQLRIEGRKMDRFDPGTKSKGYGRPNVTHDRTYWLSRDKHFAIRRIASDRAVFTPPWQISEVEWVDGVVDYVPGKRAFSIHYEPSYADALHFVQDLPILRPDEILDDTYRGAFPENNVERATKRVCYLPPFEIWEMTHTALPYHQLDTATYQSPLMKHLKLSAAEYPIPEAGSYGFGEAHDLL